ncbi:MAG: aldehyde dehydrogenase family protein [Candidatus Binatus sp.]|uniref:aldehyde dehydrogenase family protein n=1 Tax=Candidatus Binatus sp. TaxID=2811406 RepID=UPI003C7086C9
MAAVPSLERAVAGIKTRATIDFLRDSPKKLLINGKWVAAKSGKTFESINPANEEILALIAEGDKADVDAAVKAARKAFDESKWSSITPHQRSRYLYKIADLIEQNADQLAELESLDNGKPLAIAKLADIPGAARTFRYYAGWPTKIYGETNPSDPSTFNYTIREPVGVCGQIIPWNFPLSMASWKIAPALACGNTIVLKPAEQTPLTAIRLGELIQKAGVPDGVVNIITGFGPGAGSSIAEHPDVDKVAFTGSTEVGKLILQASAGNLKRVSLELGGKSPNIIFRDSDLEAAVQSATRGVFFNSGQVCTAGTRIFIEQPVYDEFVERLIEQSEKMTVGDPLDEKTRLGPVVSREQFDRVKSYLEIGKGEGAKVATGGEAVPGAGYFVRPTIFAGVHNQMRIAREEIFGPVGAAIAFKDEDDAILQGNDTTYGLAAAVWTRDVSRALKVARALKAGTVWINTYGGADPISPFGGYKQSGFGRELGVHSLDLYTQIKSVYVKL